MERVLRSRGRIGDVLPMAIAYRDAEPAAAAPRVLMLRVYSELGAQGDLVDAAELWIEESGMSAEPYREVSRVFERVFGPQRAFAVLNDGREVLEQPSLFAMEMGDLLRELGRVEEAVLEWARVIDDDGAQVSAVMRRVTEIEEDRADMVRPLVAQLASAPTTVARQRVATRIAVEAGLIEEALELAGDVAQALEGAGATWFFSPPLLAKPKKSEGPRI